MKGLRRYIARHGRHFTTELAMRVIDCRWNSSEVQSTAERVVYYNVSEATLGDMVYLANLCYRSSLPLKLSKARCVRKALDIVGDVKANGYAFETWIASGGDIDLRNYL